MNTKTPHKHCEVIKAWADGATVEYSYDGKHWDTMYQPAFDSKMGEYRIKPEPKPDVIYYGVAKITDERVFALGSMNSRSDNNIKLTFDGETNKLIKAEVI